MITGVVKTLIKAALFPLSLRYRAALLRALIDVNAEYLPPKESLRFLFSLEDELYQQVKKAGGRYYPHGHLKSYLIKYEQFFVDHVDGCQIVMDLGCGQGTIANRLAAVPSLQKVIGVDLNEKSLEIARQNCLSNVTYLLADVTKIKLEDSVDCIVLSNVLEHIEHRVALLKTVQKDYPLKKIIIRVPLFERDWRIPLRREVGAEWRLDTTHFTEYTLESFAAEMEEAGLEVIHQEIRWGEIWSVLRPRQPKGA